ncbi:SRPBCC family protein [Salipiger sp.]|uniref:SRPBCC family protein n=1 Tax=Salipiger sp. TaxID=2078585 RepID=UPI003A97350E
MTMHDLPDDYGTLAEPGTLTIQRFLPGPIERVWDHLTDSELRRKWLAGGVMTPEVGSTVTLTWRNDELSTPPGERPEEFGKEHSLDSRITVYEPPHRLGFTWWGDGTVLIELAAKGDRVLLTLTHDDLTSAQGRVMVGAGWHAHLDMLVARVSGTEPSPFWDRWLALREDYDRRFGL